jgi:asparaginyl-tRNA synthetase
MVARNVLQNQKRKAIIKVRAKTLKIARSWFDKNNFIEVQGPVLMPAMGDWPNSFQVIYFDKKAYLSQGLQPYSDAFVEMFDKIYTVAPTFRAEKAKTKRHLTEYWRIEVAAASHNLNQIIEVMQSLITHICNTLATEAFEELELFRSSIEDMSRIRKPFQRLTYDQAIDLLQKDGHKVQWGQELSWELEKILSMQFDRPFFITEFPISAQTVFHKEHPQRTELTSSADLFAPEGYGEIGVGGQNICKKDALLERMSELAIDPADQRWYLSLRRCGSGENSGFVIGLERLIQWICKLEHIKDATMFPRTPDSVYP